MKRRFFLSMCLGIASSALGQQPALKDAEFVIEKDCAHQLPEASRLFKSAPAAPHIPAPSKPLLSTLPTRWPTFDTLSRKTKLLRAQQDTHKKLYGNYLQGGYGNFYTPYLEGFFANKQHPRHAYGLHVKHLSEGQAAHFEETHNLVQLHGKLFTEHLRLGGEVRYSRDSYPLYKPSSDTSATPPSQRLHQLVARKTLANYIQGPLSYQLDASFHYLTIHQARENQWGLQGNGAYALNDTLTLKATTALHFTNHHDAKAVQRNLYRCKPMLTYTVHGFDVQGGLNLVYQNDASAVMRAWHIYPALEVKRNLHAWLLPYLGIGGDMQRNALHSFTQENPRLASNIDLRHTNQRWQFYGGVKGDVVAQLSFHTGCAVGEYQNFHCMVNSTDDPGRFKVEYDPATTLFNLFSELTHANRAETLTTRLRGDYFHYALKELAKPWHKPRYQLDLLGTYRWHHKVVFKGSLYWLGGLEALDVAKNTPVALAGVLDLSLGIDYWWNPRLSVFFNCQHLLAKYNERYLHYPDRGVCFLAGLTYAL